MTRPAALRWIFLLLPVLVAALAACFALSDEDAIAGGDPASRHGMAPMPGNVAVPLKWMPPGALKQDPGPSPVVFPPQALTIRFNHKKHLDSSLGLACKDCHAKAATSNSTEDYLLPQPQTCDGCHGTNHDNKSDVKPGGGSMGGCAFCHNGYKAGDGNRVARLVLPRANMIFSHQKHVVRNIGCDKCHGAIKELELATRDQLPRMNGCLHCHEMPDSASQGDAKSACETCHIKSKNGEGVLRTTFASGTLKPPKWLNNAGHTPDFIERHKQVAGTNSQVCAQCHSEKYCTDCHDGRVRPRSIHPNDYLNMHAIEARQATQRCTSCHREQTFCVDCHQRTGVSMSGPANLRNSGRFHPQKSEWSDAPRKPGHHAFEAQRNLNACVSCHIERDCTGCHGARGIGGGFNPHRAGFAGGCSTQFKRNPRPCYVCHEPGDRTLSQCQ